jgi:hypothetical protein
MVYSEDDLRKAMDKVYGWMIPASGNGMINNERPDTLDELKTKFIQSLKQATPKYFVPEMEEVKINSMGRVVNPTNLTQNQSSCQWVKRLKTTTKNNKSYLIGNYE